jgi:putative polymerase
LLPISVRQPAFARLDVNVAARMAVAILALSVIFNALLALVNGHVTRVGIGQVALAQAAIVAIAILVIVAARPAQMARWLIYGWAVLLLFIFLMLVRGAVEPKVAGDMLVVPAFAALGLCVPRPLLFRTMLWLQGLLVLFALYELFWPESFASLFHVKDYYVESRGFKESAFWAGNDLFLSSQRPGGRLLALGSDVGRAGSLFLEPVGLGNWTIVVMVMLATFWDDLTKHQRTLLVVSNLVLMWACDGRLAMGVIALIAISVPIYRRLGWRWLPVLYLPLVFVILSTAFAMDYLSLAEGYDSLKGRYANGTWLLLSLDLPKLFAIHPGMAGAAADSGWVNIILTQSIFGLTAYWIALTLMGGRGERASMFAHSSAVFMALALPVSYSILSIKTAATLWMLMGVAMRRAQLSEGPRLLPT